MTYAKFFGQLAELFESVEVGIDDHGGVDVSLEEALDGGENFTSENNNRSGTVTDFLILSTRQLDHTLGSGVSNIDLSKSNTDD